MIQRNEFELSGKDGLKLAAWSVIPPNPLAVLQVVHGMMEHSGRYLEFAHWMAEQGIAVYMNDHRGHGKNLKYLSDNKIRSRIMRKDQVHGHFADRNGWQKSVESLNDLTEVVKKAHPDLPVFILGHSMGSVLVQSFMRRYSDKVQGAVLSGPTQQSRFAVLAGIALAGLLRMIFNCRYRSRVLKYLSYGNYSKYFPPKRTAFDWLCSDPEVVDAYNQDPLCGFDCTTAFYSDFFHGILQNQSPLKLGPKISFCIFAGKKDPTGHFGKDPVKLAEYYRKSGCKRVCLKVWPEGRHEMLNEVNKAEVWEFIRNHILSK